MPFDHPANPNPHTLYLETVRHFRNHGLKTMRGVWQNSVTKTVVHTQIKKCFEHWKTILISAEIPCSDWLEHWEIFM